MSKIINNRLKGKQLATSYGKVQFNSDGVAEIENEELVEKLLKLNGYKLVEGDENSDENRQEEPDAGKTSAAEETTQKNDEDTSEDEPEEDDGVAETEYTEESLMEKNVPQLKKVAKDNDIDLAGATKKDEIIAVILGALNN